jgi:tetratricopeptide (TPR) repeat protein
MFSLTRRFLPLLALLPLLAGCPQVNTIRLGQDTPDDLGTLLENNEYARARMLTGKYPQIDTVEVQETITTLESAYENSAYAEARNLEAANDLHGAVELLTDALLKVPHSTLLRELRQELEQERVHQLNINEREKLITRADYLLNQKQLFRQQVKLQPPSYTQRRENDRNESEADLLAGQLVEHARYALQIGDPDAAKTCLLLSQSLKESETTSAMLDEIRKADMLAQKKTQQVASTREAKIIRNRSRDEKKKTEQLLARTQQALDDNKLQDARAALAEIPPSTSNNSEVVEVQGNVDQVISVRVNNLLLKGDTLYRADKILPALKAWTEALSLDPDNQDVRERIERANKVLAKLEALKRQQQK